MPPPRLLRYDNEVPADCHGKAIIQESISSWANEPFVLSSDEKRLSTMPKNSLFNSTCRFVGEI